MWPKQRRPFPGPPFDDEDHIVDIAIVVVVEVDRVRDLVGDIINGALQHGKLALGILTFMITHGIGVRVVRHVVFLRIVVFIGKDGLAIRKRIEVGLDVELVEGSMVEVIAH